MKRRNLIVKKAKNSKSIIIKDPKISKLFKKFKTLTFKNIKRENFALAVSGGADSLCLAYFGKIYASQFNSKIEILIVDHKLRKESKKEALKVKKILSKKGIKSSVLSWKGSIPQKNIQQNARNIRYSLISNFCMNKKIKYLLTAHHMDDQIENFFIRLFRGSGLTGLSSMSDSFTYNDNLKIIRPFLNFKKNDLKYVTLSFFKSYIEDPSNEDEKFLRVRVRKYKKTMEKEGLNLSKINMTVKNLLSANKALNFYKSKAVNKHVSFLSKNRCVINKQIFSDEAGEIIFKSFSDILSLISGAYHPPRSKKIVNLIQRLKKTSLSKSTLGGCIVENKENFIVISQESRTRKTAYQLEK